MTASENCKFDSEAIQRLRDIDSGKSKLLSDIIKLYKKESVDLIEEMNHALLQQQGDLLLRSAHTLKSSSANLGVLCVESLSKKLEECFQTDQHDFKVGAQHLEQIKKIMPEVYQYLEAFLS